MDKRFLDDFRTPGSAYRGKPFWAWNGKLEPSELRRQIRVMHDMGLGGFFMHSRVGLDTSYLSDEWFECVDACIDEAQKLSMEAWLYDEDRWPSGAAGGLVTKNPEYRMRRLELSVKEPSAEIAWTEDVLAVFTARIAGSSAADVKVVPRGHAPAGGEQARVLVFRVAVEEPSSWYNGYTYLDTLSHEAVAEFLRVTHDAYKERVGAHFGRTVPGIFTDEPNHGARLASWNQPEHAVLPWTGALPDVFRARYGYDLLPHLAELFFDVDGRAFTQARYHFHDCVTFLFVDAFARQIGEWCDRNGIKHTGHVLAEDTLSEQTNQVGSAMRFYEYMQAPGMDLLTERWRIYDTAKQVSSAARQFDRTWRLTETYGCTGWDFPFEGHKALGDWQAALGINVRCQHLAWYTMQGEAKRDYPASIFYQSPWWAQYKKVEDYFARVGVAMTQGVEVRDLLVVHPVESMWLNVKIGWTKLAEVRALDHMLIELRDTLLAASIDFDYGDEDILSRHASVANEAGVPTLRVGKAAYRAVLVPPALTLRSTTLSLLREFRKAGGQVVFAGEPARHIDALPNTDAVELAADCTRCEPKGASLVAAVEERCRRLSVLDAAGQPVRAVLHLLREDDDAYYLFVCNTGHDLDGPETAEPLVRERKAAYETVVIDGFADSRGEPLELDPESGSIRTARAERDASGLRIHTSLPRVGSRLFCIPKRPQSVELGALEAPRALEVKSRTALGTSSYEYLLSEDNCVVLDWPAHRIGFGEWQPAQEVLRVDQAVRQALGVPARGGAMVQPWARSREAAPKTVALELRYSFLVDEPPSGPCTLALEQAERFGIRLNGTPISTDAASGYWVDRSLQRVPFDPSLLCRGENVLILQCDYDASHPGLEIVYLLGAFGVRLKGGDVVVTSLPSKLDLGDWVPQGLSFYSGSVGYRCTIEPQHAAGERVFVEVPEYRGVAVRVLVDGREAGLIGWEPNEVEITDFVRPGQASEVVVQVLGHRRNSHGPLHHAEKWPTWTGPGEFVSQGDRFTDAYQLVPCGLTQPPVLVTKR